MTSNIEIRKERLPGFRFRGMGVLYLRLNPGTSRESLARVLCAELERRGVHYHMRSLKRQLIGSVSTVPMSVQQAMYDLLLRDTDLQTVTDVEYALWTAGLAVSPARRRAAYVATDRVFQLAQLWLTLNPTRSRRSLAIALSRPLALRGVELKVDSLQTILGGRQPTARREILDELLGLLAIHGIASERDAQACCQQHANGIADRIADRELVPAQRLQALALAWQVFARNPSLRHLALQLRDRLRVRGLDLSAARIQVAIAGRARTARAATVTEMESLLREVLPEGQDLSTAVSQALLDTTRLRDLQWVDAQRIATLAKRWLSAHPESSMRQLAIRMTDTVRAMGYATSSNTIQPILGGHKKKARGYVFRALRQQFPEKGESVPTTRTQLHNWQASKVPAMFPRGVEPLAQHVPPATEDWGRL